MLILMTGLLIFTPKTSVANQPENNCEGFDGNSYFKCLTGEMKICSSIVINGEAFQCRGTKKTMISPDDRWLVLYL